MLLAGVQGAVTELVLVVVAEVLLVVVPAVVVPAVVVVVGVTSSSFLQDKTVRLNTIVRPASVRIAFFMDRVEWIGLNE